MSLISRTGSGLADLISLEGYIYVEGAAGVSSIGSLPSGVADAADFLLAMNADE